MGGKVALIPDANVLRNDDKLDEFCIGPIDKARDMIEINDLEDKISILVPEVVLRELSEYKKKRLNDTLSAYQKNRGMLGGLVGDTQDKTIDVNQHIENGLERSEYRMIALPANKTELFDKIYNMSIKKEPPFERAAGASDKGFKDALILLSIIEHAKNNTDYTKYLLLTEDGGFTKNSEEIEREFGKQTGKELHIIGSKDIQGVLAKEFKIRLDFQKFLDTGGFEKIHEMVKPTIEKIRSELGLGDILIIKLDEKETKVEQINEQEFFVDVTYVVTDENRTSQRLSIECHIEKNSEDEWELTSVFCDYV